MATLNFIRVLNVCAIKSRSADLRRYVSKIMNNIKIIVCCLSLFVFSACTVEEAQYQVADHGKVVLLKYLSSQNDQFIYGAIIVTKISPQMRYPDGSISSEINYKLVIENNETRINSEGKAFESQLIKLGKEHNFPGITLNWSYKSENNIYLQSGYRGLDSGTYICITSHKEIPINNLSDIPCKYINPPKRIGVQ